MKTFRFYISAEKTIYKFTLPTKKIAQYNCGYGNDSTLVDYVITSRLRHKDFQGKVDVPLAANGEQVRSLESFDEDLTYMFNFLEDQNCPICINMLYDSLVSICKNHITKYGRLIYVDLLMYVDVFIYIYQAIYTACESTCHDTYRSAVYLILNMFPMKVFFRDFFGRTYTWADVR